MAGLSLSRRSALMGGAASALLAVPVRLTAARGKGEDLSPRALAARLDAVRAVREIKRLQHSWGHYAEAGQWAEMAALLAKDGACSLPPAAFSGRAALHAHLRETMGNGHEGLAADRLNLRLWLSPVITVSPDGRRAKGRWHEVAMIGHKGVSAGWSGGIYENDYVKTAEGWRIAALRYHPVFAGTYAGGWRNVAAVTPLVPYHYTPDLAGTPVPTVLPQGEAVILPGQLAAEAALLLAASEAQNLQAAFGFYIDRKLWDDAADLFVADARYDIAGLGAFRGRGGVLRALSRMGPAGLTTGQLNDRPMLMPVVTVAEDGQRASVRSIEIGMTGQHGGDSFWSAAIRESEMLRGSDGKWRIAAMRVIPRMRCAYGTGWADQLDALEPFGGDAEPDGPAGVAAAAYPLSPSPALRLTPTLAAPAMPRGGRVRLAEVARQLRVAAAYDGAENVADAYGYYIDEFRWRETGDLFATQGWKELSYIGAYVGRERVYQSMAGRYGNLGRSNDFLAIHQKTQPYVTVSRDGRRANIRLRLFQFNSATAGPGSWISGIYENQMVLEDGIWRIHGMDLDYVWLGDYVGGWAAIVPGSSQRYKPTPEAVAKYPPDAPLRGVTFAPFPEIAPMGFHFVNPVSGRRPDVLLPWSDGRRAAAAKE